MCFFTKQPNGERTYHSISPVSISKVLSTLLTCMCALQASAQVLKVQSSRDLSIDYIESNSSKYNFIFPVQADVLDSPNYYPNATDLYYLKAGYGSRYMSTRSNKNDNHGGIDFWHTIKHNGTNYNNTTKYHILCMCDGIISEVSHGSDAVMESTSEGRSVQVTCDEEYQSLSGNIMINYRHLDSIWTKPWKAWNTASTSDRINKGDTIGIVGASGSTSQIHLHLSAEGKHPTYGNTFVNTNRLLDPSLSTGVCQALSAAKVELLEDWPDSTLFRITWPFNQHINRFEFSNDTFSAAFDMEKAYSNGSATRDKHDVLSGFSVFSYQFNGKQTALSRYSSEKANMPAQYPASPQRDTNTTLWGYSHHPITYDSIGFVYDFIVKNIHSSHNKSDFIVTLSDVWGYTVKARSYGVLPVELSSFTGKATLGSQVLLNWETASEVNNSHFIVQHSTDGFHWSQLAHVPGHGTSLVARSYSYLHQNAAQDINYYRVKQVDYNGSFSHSHVIEVLLTETPSLVQVYPNPVASKLFILGEGIRGSTINLFTAQGQQIPCTPLPFPKGFSVDLCSLEKGVYLLKVGSTPYIIYH